MTRQIIDMKAQQQTEQQIKPVKLTMWEVRGAFILPGTRERKSFGPVKIIAASRQQASKDLAPMLNDQFRKELPEDHRFGNWWAMLNLKWQEFQKAVVSEAPSERANEECAV